MTKIAPPPFPEDMSLEEAIMCINRTSYRPIPDNSGLDLKGYNQVYLRAEAYLGWGVLAPEAFARVTEGA